MSKVRTFSRYFPKGHSRQGEKTFFVEKIWHGLKLEDNTYPDLLPDARDSYIMMQEKDLWAKLHTIRAGKHFKVGDWFSPRVWLDKPYVSKQIAIAPDLQIKQIWDYEVKCPSKGVEQWFLNGTMVSESNEYMQQWFNANLIKEIAKNDGLELADFLSWFKHPSNFSGQILCWSENVEY